MPIPDPWSFDLEAPRLRPPPSLALRCSTDLVDRVSHSMGKAFRDVVRALQGDLPRVPDLVVRPRSAAEVAQVLDWASETQAVVIPYGGGSSVVGGVEAPSDDERPILSCDLGALAGVVEIDQVSRAALVLGGTLGPDLEDHLRPRGLTLRHFPQSFERSSVGGWIATRAGGHFATGATHIDDLVEQLEVVTPQGVVATRRLPGSGAGPQPERLYLGSEGILGIITSAWLRLQDRPQFRASTVVGFDSFSAGAAAARAVVQAGLWPANCRLLDATEALISGAGDGTAHLLLLGFESADHPVEDALRRGVELARDHGGRPLETRPERASQPEDGAATRWRGAFLQAPYLRDGLVRLGCLTETFESAITWDRLDHFVDAVRRATEEALRSVGAWPGVVSCRLTHCYPDGAAPYFTVLAPGRAGAMREQWETVKVATMAAISDHGGTVTHHHGVGRDHRPGYDAERPALFAAQLRAAKSTVDPDWLLNPGVLVDR